MWKKLESTFRHVVGAPSDPSVPPPPKMPLRKTPLTAQEFDLRQTLEYGAVASTGKARVTIHPLLNLLAVASAGRVRIFGSEGVELLLESIQKDDIIFIAFCPTSTVELWNIAENSPFPAEKGFSTPISAAHYMPGSDFVYVGDEAGNVQVVNFTKPLSVATYKVALADTGGSGAVTALQVHPVSDHLLLIGYADGMVVEWDVLIRKVTRKLVVPLVAPPRPLTPPPPVPAGVSAPAASVSPQSVPPTASAGQPTLPATAATPAPPASAPVPAPSSAAPATPPKIPTVTCAAYAPDGERVVVGTSEGDLFWWRGAQFLNKMRVSDGEGPRRPVQKLLCAKLRNDELTFVMGGTLKARNESISLIRGSVGLAALSFATDEEVPIDFNVLFDLPHPSDSNPTHLVCITSKCQVIIEAFVHDPKGQYQLAMLPSPPSWLQFHPSAGITALELSTDFVVNTLLQTLPDPTNVEATSRKVDKLWPVKGGVKPKLQLTELLFTGHQDGVVRLWSLEYSLCLLREFSANPKVTVTHLQIHERAKCISVGFANGRFMLLSLTNFFRIADKPHAEDKAADQPAKIAAAAPVSAPPSPSPASPSPSPVAPSSASVPSSPARPQSPMPSASASAPATPDRTSPQREASRTSPQRPTRVLPEEILVQAQLEGTVTVAAISPTLFCVAFAALGGDVVIHDLCTGARLIHQTFPSKIISALLLVSLPLPVVPSSPPQPPTAHPHPPVLPTELPTRPQAIVATSSGDLYFINLNDRSAITLKLPCAVVGLWALNWRGEPVANCGPPAESQVSKHEAGLNPNALFLLACAETEVCLFNYPSMELELPFKVWKAQLVKRDVEYVLAVAETSGKVHIISEPHLSILARELALAQDLRFQDVYIFENSEAIGVCGSGTHVCLARGFLGTSDFALPKGKVQLWKDVQWPDRNRGFLSSLLGGDQRKAIKELFLRKPDPVPAPAAAPLEASKQRRSEAQRGVNDVKDIMAQNAQKLAERGEKLNETVLRTAELENHSRDFAANVHALTAKLQKKAWYEP